jgi:hypothetical protein
MLDPLDRPGVSRRSGDIGKLDLRSIDAYVLASRLSASALRPAGPNPPLYEARGSLLRIQSGALRVACPLVPQSSLPSGLRPGGKVCLGRRGHFQPGRSIR